MESWLTRIRCRRFNPNHDLTHTSPLDRARRWAWLDCASFGERNNAGRATALGHDVLARLGPPGESNGHWQAFLAFGFCGGFTTFSSFSWQTLEQLRQGQMGVAMLYVVVSVLICVGATWLGWRLARG